MPTLSHSARQRSPDEKLTVNLGVIDLGRIDLLVQEGFYANRTDLIRSAVRAELDRHGATVDALVARRLLVLGVRRFSAAELERARQANEQLAIRVLGLAIFDEDISPELALDAIASLTVLGALQAPAALRDTLRSLPETIVDPVQD